MVAAPQGQRALGFADVWVDAISAEHREAVALVEAGRTVLRCQMLELQPIVPRSHFGLDDLEQSRPDPAVAPREVREAGDRRYVSSASEPDQHGAVPTISP